MDTLAGMAVLTLLLLVPCAMFTAAGWKLWIHWRSGATAMIVLGFAAALISVISGFFTTYQTHAVVYSLTAGGQAQRETYFVAAHYERLPWLGILGIWAAAVGTFWHVRRQR
jgi:hypothetical protein